MTIEIKVICDGGGCDRSCEIEDTYDSAIEAAGWHVDPLDGYIHYCPGCWPIVEKEREEGEV